eukprot:6176815-Pleurochrysis_carterae.AAC.2
MRTLPHGHDMTKSSVQQALAFEVTLKLHVSPLQFKQRHQISIAICATAPAYVTSRSLRTLALAATA